MSKNTGCRRSLVIMGGTKAALCAADLIYNWMSATIKAKSKRKALYCILSEQTFRDENRMKRKRDEGPGTVRCNSKWLEVSSMWLSTQGGRSMAGSRQGVCGDHMESCHLTIWIYTMMSSKVPTNKHGANSLSETPS